MNTQNQPIATLAQRWLTACLLLPLLLFAAACDDDNGIVDIDDDDDGDIVALYDTTTVDGEQAIIVREQNGEGIGYTAGGVTTTDVTWTSDHTYIIDGRVFVNDGQTLTIEPGTVIKGRPRTDPTRTSVLIVARGGRILAEGTAQEPIIFTAEDDDVDDPDDLLDDLRGAWGGVIILGSAPTNNAGDVNIEGIPTTEARGAYGGDDPEDDSGIFRYVSIRHGGVSISANNEINGLTLGGIGSGTTIEYVEVYNNQDDGFEWFGGTVDAKYLVSAFNGDDSFDMDQGYTGRGQFWFAVQEEDPAGHTGELDGAVADLGADGEASTPYATPVIFNATWIGSGMAAGEGNLALSITDNFAGSFYNSIFVDFPEELLFIEDLDTGEDSRARFEEETLRLEGNLFADFGAGDAFADLVANEGAFGQTLSNYLAGFNRIADPQLGGVTRKEAGLDPVPAAGSPAAALDVMVDEPGAFFEDVGYVGAFAPGGTNWAEGWTFISQAGWLE